MTFALALDGRFESFGDYRQPTAAESAQPATSQQAESAQSNSTPSATPLTWNEAFGENSYLHRTSNGNSPFIIQALGKTESREVRNPEGGTYWKEFSVEDAGQWRYNGKTGGFDFYPANGKIGVSSFDPTTLSAKPTKSVSASDLGLSYDPAFMVTALATKNGKNRDSWSNYALTHNNYGDYGTDSFYRSVSGALRGDWPKITSYDAKVSGFDQFLEAAVIGGIVTIATMGFGAPLATSMQASGWSAGTAAVASNAIVGAVAGGTTAAVTGGDVGKGILLGGAGGAVNGYSSTLSKTGGLLSTSNMVNTAGKTALAAVSGSDPVATLASSVTGGAAGAATDSPFVGQLASQATRQLVGNHSAQAAQQPRTAQASSTKNTQSTQSTPGASFAYALPSFKYTDLSKRGNA